MFCGISLLTSTALVLAILVVVLFFSLEGGGAGIVFKCNQPFRQSKNKIVVRQRKVAGRSTTQQCMW